MVRVRLYFGLLPLLALVVGTGLYAIAVCREMAGSYQRELLASFDASLAVGRMRADASDLRLEPLQRELQAQARSAAGTEREPAVAALGRAFARLQRERSTAAQYGVLAAIDRLERFDYAAAHHAQEQAARLAATSIRIMAGVIVAAFLLCVVLTWRMVRSQRTLEATLNSIPDPLLVVTRDGRQKMVNPAAASLAAAGAWHGGYPPELAAPLREVLRTGRNFLPSGYERLVSLRCAGELRHYLPRILAIGDRVSGFGGAAVLLQDVTRFRLLDDAKNNLVGTVSHELKTPLTSLRMAVYLLLEPGLGQLEPGQRELLEGAREDAERLLRILNDLLDLARLESGVAGLNRRPVPVAGLLEEMAREIRPLASAQGQVVEVAVAPGVDTVQVDRGRIRHAFINLLSNANKYAPAGSTITLYAEPADDGFVRCGVRDQGPGIPAESVGAIFQKFYRVPGQTASGAGLGLAIAREIVLAHGGTIACLSKPGEGSDFHFLLPGNTSDAAATLLHSPLRASA
ncbi:MAG TPA: ATP-binding protein [Opitutaceae bacterium]|jgi:signal transduction histidine kinase|nr:ATP-binding protein [Opitutaceae bacterium]